MPLIDILWDLPDDPDGNVQHIAQHGLIPPDVEYVMNNPSRRTRSKSSDMPMVFGQLPSGENIAVVYEEIDEHTIYPITAFQVDE